MGNVDERAVEDIYIYIVLFFVILIFYDIPISIL